MSSYAFTFGLMLLPFLGTATTYQVGPARLYVSPNALYNANILQAGDTIEIDAETYSGTACLANWNKDNLVIKGVNGRPHLVADGAYIQGKGIWVLSGNDNTVENIEFSGAVVPDHNGAGIRLDGIGLTVRHCYFHDNETGILTSNQGEGDILIEFSEFDHNSYGDGFSHNVYIGRNGRLTFRYNYSHHAVVGHNLKSRANENYIYYNRIMDEESGSSSRLIDLPNGGFTILMGNLLMQGDNAPNSNMVGYGLEGLTDSGMHELYIINNTFVNKRQASCLFVDIDGQAALANISNNIFAGAGTLTSSPVTTMSNNLVEPNISDVHFVDESNYDYHLESDSPAIDFGVDLDPVNGYSLTPELMYVHPTNFSTRNQLNSIDVGAYEYEPISQTESVYYHVVSIYPNPAMETLHVASEIHPVTCVEIYDNSGRMLMATFASDEIDLSGLSAGIYYVKVNTSNGPEGFYPLIKE